MSIQDRLSTFLTNRPACAMHSRKGRLYLVNLSELRRLIEQARRDGAMCDEETTGASSLA